MNQIKKIKIDAISDAGTEVRKVIFRFIMSIRSTIMKNEL